MTRHAMDITIDISGLAENEPAEIQARLEEAVGGWDSTITVTVREYDTEA